jgi:hypothetical protein
MVSTSSDDKDKEASIFTPVTLVKTTQHEADRPVTLKRNITALAIIGLGLSSESELSLPISNRRMPC